MKRILLPFAFLTMLAACRTNETPDVQMTDIKIATEIKSTLASDASVSSVTNISVNATNSVVTLSGQVDSTETEKKVVALAKAAPKVVRVVDALQVAAKPR